MTRLSHRTAHRTTHRIGTLSGYRWGVARKWALLAREAAP